jgi:hypothetical protein
MGSPVKFPILKNIPGTQLICMMAPAIIGKKTVFRIIYNPFLRNSLTVFMKYHKGFACS